MRTSASGRHHRTGHGTDAASQGASTPEKEGTMTDHDHTSEPTAVVHVVDAIADLERAISTAENLQGSIKGLRVQIVVNGPALEGLPELSLDALPENVAMSACSVGLERREIDQTKLSTAIEVVPTAPEVIIREQLDGAAYIRL